MIATMASVAAAFAVAPTANAATDYFLEIDGIPGESTQVKDTIDVQAFQWGAVNNVTIGSASGGAGAGKASFNKLTIQKHVDVASPVLFQRLAAGQHIASMELVARKPGMPAPYLRYCLKGVFVSSLQQNGAAGETLPQETLEFAFGSLQQSYTRQDPKGMAMSPVFSGWEAGTNMLIGGSYQNSCGGTRI
jgi:type VI secretion system secreted protein Hcp